MSALGSNALYYGLLLPAALMSVLAFFWLGRKTKCWVQRLLEKALLTELSEQKDNKRLSDLRLKLVANDTQNKTIESEVSAEALTETIYSSGNELNRSCFLLLLLFYSISLSVLGGQTWIAFKVITKTLIVVTVLALVTKRFYKIDDQLFTAMYQAMIRPMTFVGYIVLKIVLFVPNVLLAVGQILVVEAMYSVSLSEICIAIFGSKQTNDAPKSVFQKVKRVSRKVFFEDYVTPVCLIAGGVALLYAYLQVPLPCSEQSYQFLNAVKNSEMVMGATECCNFAFLAVANPGYQIIFYMAIFCVTLTLLTTGAKLKPERARFFQSMKKFEVRFPLLIRMALFPILIMLFGIEEGLDPMALTLLSFYYALPPSTVALMTAEYYKIKSEDVAEMIVCGVKLAFITMPVGVLLLEFVKPLYYG